MTGQQMNMVNKYASLPLAAALLVSSLQPLLAVPTEVSSDDIIAPPSDYSKLTNQELLARFQDSLKNDRDNRCRTASLLEEMTARGTFTGNIEYLSLRYSVDCAIEQKNWDAAYQGIKAWETADVERVPTAEWALRLAYIADERKDAIDRLEKIAQRKSPEQLLSIDSDLLFGLSRELYREEQKSEIFRLYRALYDSPHFSELKQELRSAAASHVLEEQLENGSTDDADKLLEYIDSPYDYIEMLSQRKFEAIWPEVERRAGANMATVLNSYLTRYQSSHETDPRNKETIQQLAHAYHFNGRFEEVITLTQNIEHSEKGALTWEEDDGWALNLEAYAQDALGNIGKADAIFDLLATIPFDPKENGWLVSFTINRASRLVRQGRSIEGLAAAEHAGEIVIKSGSPYAKMLVWHAKACALQDLGRKKEAAKSLKLIEENHDDSYEIAADAYLCFGNRKRAAELVIAGLADEGHQESLIEALQKPQFELFYTASILPSIYSELRNHPDVDQEFRKVARDIPEKFIPLVGLKRKTLDGPVVSN